MVIKNSHKIDEVIVENIVIKDSWKIDNIR